jgi:hypothetical protein
VGKDSDGNHSELEFFIAVRFANLAVAASVSIRQPQVAP